MIYNYTNLVSVNSDGNLNYIDLIMTEDFTLHPVVKRLTRKDFIDFYNKFKDDSNYFFDLNIDSDYIELENDVVRYVDTDELKESKVIIDNSLVTIYDLINTLNNIDLAFYVKKDSINDKEFNLSTNIFNLYFITDIDNSTIKHKINDSNYDTIFSYYDSVVHLEDFSVLVPSSELVFLNKFKYSLINTIRIFGESFSLIRFSLNSYNEVLDDLDSSEQVVVMYGGIEKYDIILNSYLNKCVVYHYIFTSIWSSVNGILSSRFSKTFFNDSTYMNELLFMNPRDSKMCNFEIQNSRLMKYDLVTSGNDISNTYVKVCEDLIVSYLHRETVQPTDYISKIIYKYLDKFLSTFTEFDSEDVEVIRVSNIGNLVDLKLFCEKELSVINNYILMTSISVDKFLPTLDKTVISGSEIPFRTVIERS